MNTQKVSRRQFLKRVPPGVATALVATSRTRPILGANERIVMGIVGSGGMGRGHMTRLKNLGVEWGGVCDVYDVNLQKGMDIAGASAKAHTDHRRLL
ncbi:MAG TPA: twin-arginine translocation signal domain-containing protein, partial [Terriglobia bacterium]|nr:twin-arginine translocation signal domain-containing protein [Terriglobia bacterium]